MSMSWIDRGDDEGQEPDASTVGGVVYLLERQRDLITAVATGSRITPQANRVYRMRGRDLRSGLKRLGVADPFPWADLNEWWGYCAAPRFTTYAQRRGYVNQIVEPVLHGLEGKMDGVADWSVGAELESWATVEARLDGLKDRLDASSGLDDWQDIGRRSREILIAATNVVFSEDMVPEGGTVPQTANAKGRFDLVVDELARGSSHAELRSLMRSAWDLAQKVTHSAGQESTRSR